MIVIVIHDFTLYMYIFYLFYIFLNLFIYFKFFNNFELLFGPAISLTSFQSSFYNNCLNILWYIILKVLVSFGDDVFPCIMFMESIILEWSDMLNCKISDFSLRGKLSKKIRSPHDFEFFFSVDLHLLFILFGFQFVAQTIL